MAKKVLVIDDSPAIGVIIKMALDRTTFSVDCCLNGRKALQYLENTQPDLILLDWDMPELNGLGFREQQIANAKWKNIPTVLISGREDLEDEIPVQKFDLLPQERLAKPFQLDDLLRTVERLA